jgi:hypothetical protein
MENIKQFMEDEQDSSEFEVTHAGLNELVETLTSGNLGGYVKGGPLNGEDELVDMAKDLLDADDYDTVSLVKDEYNLS